MRKKESISSLFGRIEKKTIGIVSAFRSAHNKAENLKRSDRLESDIKDAGLEFAKLEGHYIEGYGSDSQKEPKREISFLVFGEDGDDGGSLKSFIKGIGSKYNQDSVLYKQHDNGNAHLIGTSAKDEEGNEISYPGMGKEVSVGRFKPMRIGEFYSKMKGKTFVFEWGCPKTFSDYVDFMESDLLSATR